MPISLEKSSSPNHEAAWHMNDEVDKVQAEHDLTGNEVAFEHFEVARDTLSHLHDLAGEGAVDPLAAEFVDDAIHDANPENNIVGAEVGLLEVANEPDGSPLTREELDSAPDEIVQKAMAELDAAWNEHAATETMTATTGEGVPEHSTRDEVFFHGSNYPFKIGDTIKPQKQAIIDQNGERHASATTNEDLAWAYALSKEQSTYDGFRNPKTGANYRARVYKVVPSDGEPAKYLGPQRNEVNSQSFTVVGHEDVMPGRQGTIPEINWKEHSPYVSANIITEDEIYIPPRDDMDEAYVEPEGMNPLPGLGEEYVESEQERLRIKSGRPLM